MIRPLAGLFLLFLAGCGEAPSSAAAPSPPLPVPASEVAALQAVADDACRCNRASPDDKSCWEAFNARTAAHGDAALLASACAPVSTEMTCFKEDHPEARFCIATGHHLVGTDHELCSAEEVRIVDTTFTATLRRTGDDYEQAHAAADKVANDLILGRSVPLPEAEGGCAG